MTSVFYIQTRCNKREREREKKNERDVVGDSGLAESQFVKSGSQQVPFKRMKRISVEGVAFQGLLRLTNVSVLVCVVERGTSGGKEERNDRVRSVGATRERVRERERLTNYGKVRRESFAVP